MNFIFRTFVVVIFFLGGDLICFSQGSAGQGKGGGENKEEPELSVGGRLPRPGSRSPDAVQKFREKISGRKQEEKQNGEEAPEEKQEVNAGLVKLEPVENVYCHSFLSTPFNPLIYMDLTKVYLLVRTKIVNKNTFKYQLMELSISADSVQKGVPSKKIFSVDGPMNVALMPNGAPPTGFTIVSFSGPPVGCGKGRGVGVTIPAGSSRVTRRNPAKTMSSGYYMLLGSQQGRMFASSEKQQVKDIDPRSYQSRTVFSFDPGQIPLYWDSDKKALYVWYTNPHLSVLRLVGSSTNKTGRIRLNPGEKLIQDRNKFGLTKTNLAKNTISVAEIKRWSNVVKNASYTISLPNNYAVAEASVRPYFEDRLLLIYGGTERSKEVWDAIFLYSYERRSLLSKLRIDPGEYVDGAAFSPNGKGVFVVTADKKTHLHSGVKFFDRNKLAWVSVDLN